MVRQQGVMRAGMRLGLLVLAVTVRVDEAGDKKARLTPEECERLVEQLVSPDKPRFTENHVPLTEKALLEKQKTIKAAYDKLSANIEVALPILVTHVHDQRFSYVYEDVYRGAYIDLPVGAACCRMIFAHVEVYREHVTRVQNGRLRSLSFLSGECGGIDNWWKSRKNNTLAELQLEGIEWAMQWQKPSYFESEQDWGKARKALEKMAKGIRGSKKPIQVKHQLRFVLD